MKDALKLFFKSKKRVLISIVVGALAVGSGGVLATNPAAQVIIIETICQVSGGCDGK